MVKKSSTRRASQTAIDCTPPIEPPNNPQKQSLITKENILNALVESLQPDAKTEKINYRDDLIRQFLIQETTQDDIYNHYNILILHDEGTMLKADADHIYSAAKSFKESKPILLILYSSGGVIASAYLIGKLCREYSKGKFVVVVPRQAKSAATLLCCAADEIHMGSLSELGPIDPQIDELPALGLKASVNHICDLVKEYPNSSEMFAKYLSSSLNPVQLGYYERVAESAAQYAERLLKTHILNLDKSPDEIAKTLVYSYKDHGFVIDKNEASDIFSSKTIKINTAEYLFGNTIYEKLIFISRISKIFNHYFYLIGSFDSPLNFLKD
jgi:ClpP class serine protease